METSLIYFYTLLIFTFITIYVTGQLNMNKKKEKKIYTKHHF